MAFDPDKPEKITTPDDPRRCQGDVNVSGQRFGQCEFVSIPGTNKCKYHQNHTLKSDMKKEELRKYNLGKWQQRVGQMANTDDLKSLTEEIGILRVLLENVMARCTDEMQLELQSVRISDLALKIEKLIKSCHFMELQTGKLLSKSQVIILAGRILGVLTEVIRDHIPDKELQEFICDVTAQRIAVELENDVPIDE